MDDFDSQRAEFSDQHLVGAGGDPSPAAGPSSLRASLIEHVRMFLGESHTVLIERSETLPDLEIRVVPPRAPDPAWTVFTVGMSSKPMKLPSDERVTPWAELVMRLSPNWSPSGHHEGKGAGDDVARGGTSPASISERMTGGPSSGSVGVRGSKPGIRGEAWWPAMALVDLARFVHEYRTFFWDGHLVPNGYPPEALGPGVPFGGAMLRLPGEPMGFGEVRAPDGRRAQFLAVIPLLPDEVEMALDRPSSLLEAMDGGWLSEVVDPARGSIVGRMGGR